MRVVQYFLVCFVFRYVTIFVPARCGELFQAKGKGSLKEIAAKVGIVKFGWL